MEYHKIQSVFKRDPATGNKRFLMDAYSLPEFAYLAQNQWVGTEKVDGTNIRLYRNGRIHGKTDSAQIHSGLFERLREVAERVKRSSLPDDAVLYGEGYGAKIQSGGHYLLDRQGFVLFDLLISGNFQPREQVLMAALELDLPTCPVLGIMSLVDWVSEIKSGSFRESRLHVGGRNEGVVLRPLVELSTRTGGRVITKLKFKDFA